MDFNKIAKENLIYECVTGSHAYGLNTPESDLDTRGIFIPPREIILSPFYNVEQVEDKEKEDRVIYSLDKFIVLLSKANPNIIDLVFAHDSDVLHSHPVMGILLKERDIFITQQTRKTFTGYAMAQLKRIKGHNKHLSNPQPKEHPAVVNYLKWITPDGKVILVKDEAMTRNIMMNSVAVKVNNHTYIIFDYLFNPARSKFVRPFVSPDDPHNLHPIEGEAAWKFFNESRSMFIYRGTVVYAMEEYKHDTKLWENYWSWKNNRNKKRAKLENDHGFDTKHGMHLMRLLAMGREILSGNGVKVKRDHDKEYLMDIRNGKVSYDELYRAAERDLEYIDSLESSLPKTVDIKKVSKIYSDMLEAYWYPTKSVGDLIREKVAELVTYLKGE